FVLSMRLNLTFTPLANDGRPSGAKTHCQTVPRAVCSRRASPAVSPPRQQGLVVPLLARRANGPVGYANGNRASHSVSFAAKLSAIEEGNGLPCFAQWPAHERPVENKNASFASPTDFKVCRL